MIDYQNAIEDAYNSLVNEAENQDGAPEDLALRAFTFSCMRILRHASQMLDDGAMYNRIGPMLRDMLVVAVEHPRALLPGKKTCRMFWRAGLITPPGVPNRPSGACQLEEGHEGDHIFPNNNRQPNET